jgi:hypothetical protein
MAVVEIAKIQVRRGQENQTGVPQLDGGEFAWAADTEQLYIGLKIADGGSRDENVRILTENDERNFFALGVTSSTYTYRIESGITARNGFSEEFERTVQSKLDDIVNISDFGAVGGTGTFDTAAIQLAIDRLFLDTMDFESNEGRHPGKKLYFPAGIYNLTATIYIPRYTTIVGEGIDKTIFNISTTGTHVFQTCDYSSNGGGTGYVHFDNTTTINSLTQPKGVYLEDMTLRYAPDFTDLDNSLSLLSLDCANDAVIKRVKFKGIHTPNDLADANYSGIDIRGFGEVTSENVLIDNCIFEGLHSCVKSNYDIISPTIKNSEFYDSVRGVNFNAPKDLGAVIGPRYARINNNRFENIEEQGIYAGINGSSTGTFHISQNNTFVNVGNYFNQWGERSSTGTAVISFLSEKNSSIDDYFDRYHFQQAETGTTVTYNAIVDGRTSVDNTFVSTATIFAEASTKVIRLPITEYSQQIVVKYNVFTPDITDRMGTLTVLVRPSNDPDFIVTDDYTYNTGDGGISWSVNVDSGYRYLEIIAASGAADDAIIEYQIKLMI